MVGRNSGGGVWYENGNERDVRVKYDERAGHVKDKNKPNIYIGSSPTHLMILCNLPTYDEHKKQGW